MRNQRQLQAEHSKSEQNYCQLEKELLAIVFGMHDFDQYVYGRHVWVESDHKPLEVLLKKPLKMSQANNNK